MKTCIYIYLALFMTTLLSIQLEAQNLLGNGDFELVSSPPSAQGQLARAIAWRNCNGQTAFPYATPDLFTEAATGGLQWPNTFAGTVAPQSGNALAGFITSNFFVPDFREYVCYPLSAPMLVGQTYTVSFWLTNGSGNWYGARGSNNIGVAFTIGAPVQIQHEPLPVIPQIEMTSIIHNTVWTKYTFTFLAGTAYNHITIGNFRNDLATSTAVFTSGNGVAYYFIDNVEVRQSLPLPAENLQLQQLENDDLMSLNWHLPENATGDEIALERSTDQNTFTQVEDFGKVTNAGADVTYKDATALAGLQYYYRLRDLSPNGELRYSPVIAAKFGKGGDFVAGHLYPNPIRDRFFLDFTALVQGELEMRLLDAAGRLIHTETQTLEIGQPSTAFNVPTGTSTGIYHAQFNFQGQTFTKKVVIASAN
jgi:hypothetical protein